MLVLARESLYEVVEDVQPLLEMHYQELTRGKGLVALAPIWEKYAALEAANPDLMHIFTAREDGALVGYAVFFCQPHMHYRDLFPAVNDILFVHPRCRGLVGVRLIRFCERELSRYADKITWGAKSDTTLERLLPKMGYAREDVIFGKFLNKSAAAQEN